MASLIERVSAKALKLGVPLNAHLDLTYRCNESCVHCYLDHHHWEEMSTGEVLDLLEQMAQSGVLFLTLSGGEIFLRPDLFAILERARALLFDLRLKTNGTLIGEEHADRLATLGISEVHISIYSHRPEVHDAITRVPGSLARSLDAVRLLRAYGIPVTIADVVMRQNVSDRRAVKVLAAELGAGFKIDPTITPGIEGNVSIASLNISHDELESIFHDEELVGDVNCFTAPPGAIDESVLDGIPCSAGHNSCYIAPNGDVFPCVQFPLRCGNIREQPFETIWRHSPEMLEVRAIHARDLNGCRGCAHLGTCSRCPGLAYVAGDMRGPSSADCEKAFVRTGIAPANMPAEVGQ